MRPVFESYVASHGLEDRLCFEAGDFFRDELPSADVLALGRVLHNWDLPTKRMLLAKAYAALPPGGAIIVFERMIDDERRRNATGLLASLNMLLSTPGGFDATCADIALWLKEAGFDIDRVESLPLDHSMVVGVKPRR